MTEYDKPKFLQILTGLAENYGQTVTTTGIGLRFSALRAYRIEEIERAAISLLTSRKYTSMPTVADFLEHLGGGSAEDKAEVEAGKVLDAIRSYGAYRSVVFDDPVTMAVISRAFGGWVKLCVELSDREEKFFRKDFAKAYGSFSRQGIREGGVLLGLAERENASRGLEYKEKPKLIGNPSKASQVMALEAGHIAGLLGEATCGND